VIEGLIRGLATGTDLTPEEILDVLWLSAIRAGPALAPASQPPPDPAAPADHDEPERAAAPPPPGHSSAPPPSGQVEPPPIAAEEEITSEIPLRLPATEPAEAPGDDEEPAPVQLTTASEVGFGAPRPIRDAAALPRALRRLRHVRRPAPHVTVDVDATVEATADAGGTLVPVYTRPLERALDLALVVDDAPAMRVWDDTFDEFARLMAQTGAFRSVERWRLITDEETVSLADASGKVQPADRLIDPSGQRVVFVATSASTDAWYTPGPWVAVAAWCAAMPTALLQVLPRQYWAGTALGEPYVTARADRPAAPNGEYVRRQAWWADDPGGMPLPVVTLSPGALETWAQAVVTGNAWTPGITATPPDPEHAPSAADLDTGELVNDFLSRASPGAERLARLLSTATRLSLPLIAILQESLAPETGVLELAEVLSSGLLSVDGAGGLARFRFRDDARQLLRRGVTTFEEWDAYAAVSRYLESRHQLGGPLGALLPDPDGTAVLDPADEPFAALHESLATRLGLRTAPGDQHSSRDNQAAASQPPRDAESQEIPEDLLTLLVSDISELRPPDTTMAVVAFDAAGVSFWRIQLDGHGTLAHESRGGHSWEVQRSGETFLSPQGYKDIFPWPSGEPAQRVMFIRKPGTPPEADELVNTTKQVSRAKEWIRECYFDTDVARAISEAIARCPLTRSYELVTLNLLPGGQRISVNRYLPLFPPGAVRGDRKTVRLRCQPSDSHGTVFAVMAFDADEPVLVTSAKVPPGLYDVTAELLAPGSVRFAGLPAEPRKDPRPWSSIVATVPDLVDLAGLVHLILAIELSGPAQSLQFKVARDLITATERSGVPVVVSVVLYDPIATRLAASHAAPLVLLWTADTRHARDLLAIHQPRRTEVNSTIEDALALLASRLRDEASGGRPVLITIGVEPPEGDWSTPVNQLVADHPGITFGHIWNIDSDIAAERLMAHRMWEALGRTASTSLDHFDAQQFAQELGLLAATPTPVPFPLAADVSLTDDHSAPEKNPMSADPGERVISLTAVNRDQWWSQAEASVIRFGRFQGRISMADLILIPDLTVSKRHAELRLPGSGRGNSGNRSQVEIVDLGSDSGTFVNGNRVTRAYARDNDVIAIGKDEFRLLGEELLHHVGDGRISLQAQDVGHRVTEGRDRNAVLDQITFSLPERSMMAVIGPSGAGKTTLCNALTARAPAAYGDVRYNGRSLYEHFQAFEHRIGVVFEQSSPSNIGGPRPLGRLRRGIRDQLTAREALGYAAKQRFASDTTDAERAAHVDQLLNDLPLDRYLDSRINTMPPYPRKLVDLGLALLTDPSILFLDEPFAPISVESGLDLSQRLRAMADPSHLLGRSVVIFTRFPAALPQCDWYLVLTTGGGMAYFGPSVPGLRYFGAESWDAVNDTIRGQPTRDFAAEFRASPEYQRYVSARSS